MTSYSMFFSSGLAPSHDILAAYPRPRPRMDSTSSTLSVMSTISISTIKSPITGETVDDASDVEGNEYTTQKEDRETTPTPQTPKTTTGLPTKTLRRRKSSVSVSPVTVSRSPAKAAENAFSYQRHLSRSRSGSVSSAIPHEGTFDATITTPRVTERSRSGSIGTVLKLSRRNLRQPLPPPSVPLPPVPPCGSVAYSIPRRKHSLSTSFVPRLLGPSASHDLLPPLPPAPSYGISTGSGLA